MFKSDSPPSRGSEIQHVAQAARVPLRTVRRLRRGPSPLTRDDILTAMAEATFPDGSTPEVKDVALIAANLFTAGQETTVRLLSFAAAGRSASGPTSRSCSARTELASPTSSRRRCGSRARSGASSAWPAGPRRSAASRSRSAPPSCCSPAPPTATRACSPIPDEFDVDRANARYHIAFGHGIHHCRGGRSRPGRGSGHPQPAPRPHHRHHDLREGARSRRAPATTTTCQTYFLRGLTNLHLEFTPV